MLKDMIFSNLLFSKIFSMAKIKVAETVPGYLINEMVPVVWDSWWGDTDNGKESNKLACYCAFGDVHTYFCFGRSGNPSVKETYTGSYLQFCALVINYDGKWFTKSFSKDDLKSVKDTVGKDYEKAISSLGLLPVNITNPLQVIP